MCKKFGEKYLVVYGLGGSFRGSRGVLVADFLSLDEAMKYARELSIEEYQSYEGCGVQSLEEVIEQLAEDEGIEFEDVDEGYAEEEYEQEVESWLDYEVYKVGVDKIPQWAKDVAEDSGFTI
ncbi:MAG: hypothetical protein ACRDD8_15860 [Bacteroidales bacterium]